MNDIARRRLAERLRDARQRSGLSQQHVAARLGVPRPAISHIETGQRRVEAIELSVLAHMYGRTIGYFTSSGSDPQLERLVQATIDMSEEDQREILAFVEHLKRSRS